MRKQLPLLVLSSSHFTWTGDVGSTWESDLPEHYASRVWNDSCDYGFEVKSERTGNRLLFVRGEDMRAPDGELLYRLYASTDGRITIKIFND